jgi:Protein of unknown function (DUF3108)
VLLAGCAGAEAMTASPAPPTASSASSAAITEIGLHPGETMSFEIRLAGMLAGEAQLAVGEIGDYEGHRAVVVKSRAATAGAAALIRRITDEATTTIDIESGRPLALETLVEQGNNRTTATATFAGSVANITYVRTSDPAPQTLRIDFGTNQLHDMHTAMAQVRGWRATPGTRRSVFVVGGRRLWRIDVTYAGEDMVGTSLGNRRAVRFTGESYRANRRLVVESDKPSRTFTVWLTDDADRVPLKVAAKTELGEIAMELIEYSR